MRTLYVCGVVLLVAWILPAAAEDHDTEKSPAFGDWKGFRVGTYLIEKNTYSGVGYHKDGVEYRRIVLARVGEGDAARYQEYTAETPTGPWKIAIAHSDVAPGRPGEHVERKELAGQDLLIGGKNFPCSIVLSSVTNDWGKRTTKQWVDKESGLDLRTETSFQGQDQKGQPVRWTSSLVTTGLEKRTMTKEEINCFVQESTHSSENGGGWWRTAATAKVPGHRLSMTHAKSKGAPVEVDLEVLEWGCDPSLLAELKETSPLFFDNRQRHEEDDRKKTSDALEKQLVANLESGDQTRMLSGMNGAAAWADSLAPANKAAAIDALEKAFEHPSANVRRRAAQTLGQLGVKSLSDRIIELLKQDPDGAGQYLSALGYQSDAEALRAILPYTSSANEQWRRSAVTALRFFKIDGAREAVEKALGDPAWEVRLVAVESLGKIADRRSVPALLRALRDANPLIVRGAIPVIVVLGDDAAVPSLLELLKAPDEDVRWSICLYIGKMRLTDARRVGDALLPLLDDPSPKIQQAAIGSLGGLRDKQAVPRLLQVIADPVHSQPENPWIRPQAAAMFALGQIGDASAIPVLVKYLDVPEAGTTAAEALATIGDPAAAKYLFEHYVRTLSDEKLRRVHGKELEAIGKLGTQQTRADLEKYLARCPPLEKERVRTAIGAIDQRLGH
jgi:HEAT repeat protein